MFYPLLKLWIPQVFLKSPGLPWKRWPSIGPNLVTFIAPATFAKF